jgi:hypothetical protein
MVVQVALVVGTLHITGTQVDLVSLASQEQQALLVRMVEMELAA